jgi:transposase
MSLDPGLRTIRDMRLDVISVVERRRRWSAEDKVRILDEASRPGAVIASVLARHNVSGSLFYRWRREAREGLMPGVSVRGEAPAGFAPVMLAATCVAESTPPSSRPVRCEPTTVEIVLTNGRMLKISDSIDPAVLSRLVTAVDSSC